MKRVAALALILLVVAGLLTAAGWVSKRKVEIRGKLSLVDLSGVIREHCSSCPSPWLRMCPKWFGDSTQQYVSAWLNPIDVIAVPKDGEAIVVYRGFWNFYYDKQGKHRWGTAAHTIRKDSNGWHAALTLPDFP